MPKETFYFSHDYNTRTDTKIKKLLAKLGYEGYGLWWAIVEDLYNNANALPLDYDCIAYDLKVPIELIKRIINDFFLFEIKDGFFMSLSIKKRLDKRNEKSEKARQSAFKKWDKQKKYANALPTQNDRNAIKESKVNKNKVKESKETLGLSPEEKSFEKFIAWATINAPNILKMSAPLDSIQLVKLKGEFTIAQIQEMFLAMHNRKNLVKDNVSAYLTFLNWAKRRDWGKTAASEIDEKSKKAIFG